MTSDEPFSPGGPRKPRRVIDGSRLERGPENGDPTYDDYPEFRAARAPLVVDNGCWELRAGWATDAAGSAAEAPRLQFPNVIAKFRDRRTGRTVLHAGHDALSPLADPSARLSLRTAFEGNIVTNVDVLETVLDYSLTKLGVSGESRVDHPVVMTEPVANLSYSRKVVSELLFEGYNVPSVCYGIDALFSYHANTPDPSSGGLVISSGHEATHVLPYTPGNALYELVRRITFGGAQAAAYFLALLQAKYPDFPARVTPAQAEALLRETTHVSGDYLADLRAMDDPAALDAANLVVQFPFALAQEKPGMTEEERLRFEEKKKEQGRRLQEQAQRKKEERIAEMEAYIGELRSVVAMKEEDPRGYAAKLKWHQLKGDEDLDAALEEAEGDLHRIRVGGRKGRRDPERADDDKPPPTDLLDVPDDALTEDQKREKKRQRSLKASWEAREKIKREKEEVQRRTEEAARKEEEKRRDDFEGWLKEKHERRKDLVERIRARKKKKEQLQDRRSQASKARMRTVANLAKDDEGPAKRRRRGQDDDNFGADDADWHVYREIGGEDSDGEEAEITELGHIDALLEQHDPNFQPDDVDEDQKLMRKSIVYRLAYGAYAASAPRPQGKEEQAAMAHQIHLNVERIRVPEVLFQPSIVGLDQAGIVEIIAEILKRVDARTQDALMRNVLVTGTHSIYPDLIERLESELRAIRPVGSPLMVRRAADPRLDAWRGAAMWAAGLSEQELRNASLTREEYLEGGEEYLKEFAYSNRR
ncbi:putative chromatin remodeling complex subunit [Hyaloraphidium curvatum]|nr:putative chromatin remodeling complex subunit [Hyaloraphidium curvatum]